MAPADPANRAQWRTRLLAERDRFAAGPRAAVAHAALAAHLVALLHRLEPHTLGLYWPLQSEFNAAAVCATDAALSRLPRALPFARKTPRTMDYRFWDGATPSLVDECGIGSASGAVATPDVVLVPCVGFTADGHRLGYGGGYFDRWLAAHPAVTSVGLAWSVQRIAGADLRPAPHDQTLTLVLTEDGVVS